MAANDIVIEVNGQPTTNSAGGFLDTITDLNFGAPGGTFTFTFLKDITISDPFTARATPIKKGVTLLAGSTNPNFIDADTQWIVYYPRQMWHSFVTDGSVPIHWVPDVDVPGGYASFKNAVANIVDDGIYAWTSRLTGDSEVFYNAYWTQNFYMEGGWPNPLTQWSDWDGFGNSFRGKTAAASHAASYSAFLNEGYPPTWDNGALARTTVDHLVRQRTIVKVKVPRAARTYAAAYALNKPDFAITVSPGVTLGTDVVPIDPKRPVSAITTIVGTKTTYTVYALPHP